MGDTRCVKTSVTVVDLSRLQSGSSALDGFLRQVLSDPVGCAAMNELASRLWLTGHAHAHRALLDYGTPVTAHFAALSAGAALEHLVKSRIARINPVLLANKGDLPTLKLLSGVSGLRGDDAVKMEQVKTVGGVDAVQRYNDLYPQHKISVFTQAFNARNASAHLGFGDLQSAHLALLDLVRSVPTLCAARLRKTPSTKLLSQRALSAMEVAQNAPSFWGDRHAEVVALAVEADARDAFVLETRRSRAVERFEARYGFILDAQTRRAVIAGAAEQRPPQPPEADVTERVACYACGSPAWLLYDEDGQEEPEEEDGRYYRVGWAFLSRLQCRVCDLELSASELRRSPIDVEFIIESSRTEIDAEEWQAAYDAENPTSLGDVL